jgi:hypothetical protein
MENDSFLQLTEAEIAAALQRDRISSDDNLLRQYSIVKQIICAGQRLLVCVRCL